MIDFIWLTLPIFGAVGVGWLFIRYAFIQRDAVNVLSAYSFKLALPALVFKLIANQPIGQSFDIGFYGAYLIAGACVMLGSLLFFRYALKLPLAISGAYASTAAVSNLGFLGAPLLLVVLGDHGAGPLAMGILSEIMVLMSIGGVIMGSAHGDGLHRFSKALATAARNPIICTIAAGFAVSASGIAIPGPVNHFLSFVGSSAGPTALFALGGTLGLQRLERSTWINVFLASIAKVLLYPIVAWMVLGYLFQMPTAFVQAGVVLAALPSASIVFVVANRYAADEQGVSAAIVLSTAISVLTVPLFAWLVHSPYVLGAR